MGKEERQSEMCFSLTKTNKRAQDCICCGFLFTCPLGNAENRGCVLPPNPPISIQICVPDTVFLSSGSLGKRQHLKVCGVNSWWELLTGRSCGWRTWITHPCLPAYLRVSGFNFSQKVTFWAGVGTLLSQKLLDISLLLSHQSVWQREREGGTRRCIERDSEGVGDDLHRCDTQRTTG